MPLIILGTEEWEYEFVEEKAHSQYNLGLSQKDTIVPTDDLGTAENRPNTLHLVNGNSFEDNQSSPPSYSAVSGDMDGRKKSVTFAPQSSKLNDSTVSQISPNTYHPVASNSINIPGNLFHSIMQVANICMILL